MPARHVENLLIFRQIEGGIGVFIQKLVDEIAELHGVLPFCNPQRGECLMPALQRLFAMHKLAQHPCHLFIG